MPGSSDMMAALMLIFLWFLTFASRAWRRQIHAKYEELSAIVSGKGLACLGNIVSYLPWGDLQP
jgi:hypothetical protein